jgi:hypothetical protein
MAQLSTQFRVGKDYICEMSFDTDKNAIQLQWRPHAPVEDKRTEEERDQLLEQYRIGRDTFLAEVSKAIGRPVLVAEG